MKKGFLRIVAALMVPCLLLDAAIAGGLGISLGASSAPLSAGRTSLDYAEQAFANRAVNLFGALCPTKNLVEEDQKATRWYRMFHHWNPLRWDLRLRETSGVPGFGSRVLIPRGIFSSSLEPGKNDRSGSSSRRPEIKGMTLSFCRAFYQAVQDMPSRQSVRVSNQLYNVLKGLEADRMIGMHAPGKMLTRGLRRHGEFKWFHGDRPVFRFFSREREFLFIHYLPRSLNVHNSDAFDAAVKTAESDVLDPESDRFELDALSEWLYRQPNQPLIDEKELRALQAMLYPTLIDPVKSDDPPPSLADIVKIINAHLERLAEGGHKEEFDLGVAEMQQVFEASGNDAQSAAVVWTGQGNGRLGSIAKTLFAEWKTTRLRLLAMISRELESENPDFLAIGFVYYALASNDFKGEIRHRIEVWAGRCSKDHDGQEKLAVALDILRMDEFLSMGPFEGMLFDSPIMAGLMASKPLDERQRARLEEIENLRSRAIRLPRRLPPVSELNIRTLDLPETVAARAGLLRQTDDLDTPVLSRAELIRALEGFDEDTSDPDLLAISNRLQHAEAISLLAKQVSMQEESLRRQMKAETPPPAVHRPTPIPKRRILAPEVSQLHRSRLGRMGLAIASIALFGIVLGGAWFIKSGLWRHTRGTGDSSLVAWTMPSPTSSRRWSQNMSIDRDLEKWGPDLAAEERRFEQHLNNPADPLLQFGISAERLGAAYETLDILDDGSAPATRFGRVAWECALASGPDPFRRLTVFLGERITQRKVILYGEIIGPLAARARQLDKSGAEDELAGRLEKAKEAREHAAQLRMIFDLTHLNLGMTYDQLIQHPELFLRQSFLQSEALDRRGEVGYPESAARELKASAAQYAALKSPGADAVLKCLRDLHQTGDTLRDIAKRESPYIPHLTEALEPWIYMISGDPGDAGSIRWAMIMDDIPTGGMKPNLEASQKNLLAARGQALYDFVLLKQRQGDAQFLHGRPYPTSKPAVWKDLTDPALLTINSSSVWTVDEHPERVLTELGPGLTLNQERKELLSHFKSELTRARRELQRLGSPLSQHPVAPELRMLLSSDRPVTLIGNEVICTPANLDFSYVENPPGRVTRINGVLLVVNLDFMGQIAKRASDSDAEAIQWKGRGRQDAAERARQRAGQYRTFFDELLLTQARLIRAVSEDRSLYLDMLQLQIDKAPTPEKLDAMNLRDFQQLLAWMAQSRASSYSEMWGDFDNPWGGMASLTPTELDRLTQSDPSILRNWVRLWSRYGLAGNSVKERLLNLQVGILLENAGLPLGSEFLKWDLYRLAVQRLLRDEIASGRVLLKDGWIEPQQFPWMFFLNEPALQHRPPVDATDGRLMPGGMAPGTKAAGLYRGAKKRWDAADPATADGRAEKKKAAAEMERAVVGRAPAEEQRLYFESFVLALKAAAKTLGFPESVTELDMRARPGGQSPSLPGFLSSHQDPFRRGEDVLVDGEWKKLEENEIRHLSRLNRLINDAMLDAFYETLRQLSPGEAGHKLSERVLNEAARVARVAGLRVHRAWNKNYYRNGKGIPVGMVPRPPQHLRADRHYARRIGGGLTGSRKRLLDPAKFQK